MRVFILGGTGCIGAAIVAQLHQRGHQITGLCRSHAAADRLRQLGARPLQGDLTAPQDWAAQALDHDAIIHAAIDFDSDMGAVDVQVVDALLTAPPTGQTRMLYTGGCWLYGATGDHLATEADPFHPIDLFAWMLPHADRLLQAPHLSTAILHPALVYHAQGGAFDRFLTVAARDQPIPIWGDPATRWPLIDRRDLARAYAALLEAPELTGHFNATGQTGVPVGDIARACAQVKGSNHAPICVPRETVLADHGAWGEGPMLDQQMSHAKLTRATGWQPQHTDFRQVLSAPSSL